MDPAERIVFIDDNNPLSAALHNHIEQQSNVRCGSLDFESLRELQQNDLAILNANSDGVNSISKILSDIQTDHICRSVAIYNVRCDEDATKYIKWPIVKGIFCMDDSLELLVSGIKAIIHNDHWFSRKHTSILASLRTPPCPDTKIGLTEREKDILSLISNGLANQEIATQLAISPHTVKTHLYKAYKKLGIKNRSQAARWVQINSIEPYG